MDSTPSPTAPEPIVPTGAEHRRGPFKPGDQVQLTDAKGRMSTITLQAGKQYHTHKGSFDHDELIGSPEFSRNCDAPPPYWRIRSAGRPWRANSSVRR